MDHREIRRQRGATVLELCAAMTLSATAALSLLGGIRPLSCAFRIEAARTTVVDAMLEARRRAYESETSVAVQLRAGDSSLAVVPPGSARPLGDGVVLTAVPSDENVQFRPSGLADNATIAIACGAATASVVVNQRGVVR